MTRKFIGYHGTFCPFVDDILNNCFTYSPREDHWLGQGIYFYNDDCRRAYDWAKIKRKNSNKHRKMPAAIIKCYIQVYRDKLLDLNKSEDARKVKKYAQEIVVSSEFSYKFDPENEKKNRCLLYDIISDMYDIKVISAPFINKEYSTKSCKGIKFNVLFCEQQICVKNQDVILSRECIFKEEQNKFTMNRNVLKKKPLRRN
jgi:hypothetical protein